ncbi:MAG: DNA repair protein RecO [Acholeplasmatales bacterium]|nr:DNA repair protein RecO [Acholeplasmatales bacterium]
MKSEGIVLSETDYKETSKIVNLYTPMGKIGVKALGSKRIKNGLLGFTNTGNTVEFVATDSSLPTLEEYTILDSIYTRFDDLKTAKALGVVIRILNDLPADIDNKRLYPFVKGIVEALGKVNNDKVIAVFLIKILYVYGIAPNLKSCVKCGSTNELSFVPELGGAVCKDHGLGNIESLKIWNEYYYDKKKLNDYSDTDFNLLLGEIKAYYNYHLGYRINY